MYWNGVKEVTKEEVRNIFESELKRQGVKEMWTTDPTDFENRDIRPFVAVVTDNKFDTSVLDACYDNEDLTTYLHLWDVKDISQCKKIFKGLVCIYKGGVWLDADKSSSN